MTAVNRCAQIYRYCLPMQAGVVLRNRQLKTREGLLLCVQQGDKQGWGEIAPLTGFSQETVEEALYDLTLIVPQWLAGGEMPESSLPSVAFGVSCACAELYGELPEQANYHSVMLCTGDVDALLAKLAALPGNKVAKIKVGLYEAVRDGLMVNMLLSALPSLYLRLDANRCWNAEKAANFAKYILPEQRARIEFLEEPCSHPDMSRHFAQISGINIAWDETMREADFILRAEPGVSAVVIKPTLTGSLARCQALVQQAHQLGLRAVISSSIETSLGLNQLARIAQWLTPQTQPGIDTISLISMQLLRPWPGCDLPLLTAQDLECIWKG